MRAGLIWKEKHPVRGEIRRTIRSIKAQSPGDICRNVGVIAIMGAMIIMTLITIGVHPLSPAAVFASSRDISSCSTHATGHDPRTQVTVNGADHGHLAGGAE